LWYHPVASEVHERCDGTACGSMAVFDVEGGLWCGDVGVNRLTHLPEFTVAPKRPPHLWYHPVAPRPSSEQGVAKEVHERCDGKGPTVTLYRSANGFSFGGYTSVAWESPSKEQGVAKGIACFAKGIAWFFVFYLKPLREWLHKPYSSSPALGGTVRFSLDVRRGTKKGGAGQHPSFPWSLSSFGEAGK
jgi:hypothetical protein